MRGILAAIWGLIVCAVVIVVVGFCATLKFPAHSTEDKLMRAAGVVVGLGLGINAYQKNSKPPSPPAAKA